MQLLGQGLKAANANFLRDFHNPAPALAPGAADPAPVFLALPLPGNERPAVTAPARNGSH